MITEQALVKTREREKKPIVERSHKAERTIGKSNWEYSKFKGYPENTYFGAVELCDTNGIELSLEELEEKHPDFLKDLMFNLK